MNITANVSQADGMQGLEFFFDRVDGCLVERGACVSRTGDDGQSWTEDCVAENGLLPRLQTRATAHVSMESDCGTLNITASSAHATLELSSEAADLEEDCHGSRIDGGKEEAGDMAVSAVSGSGWTRSWNFEQCLLISLEMMLQIDDLVVRHLAFAHLSVQLLVAAEEYDMDFILKMFDPEMLGYSVGRCRLIMTPVTVDESWCLYVFDMVRSVVNVLDPLYTDHSEDEYAEKHASIAHSMLQGIAAIGRELEHGWDIDIQDWDVAYNMEMHPPCPRHLSGPYVVHYARNFNGQGMDNELDAGGLVDSAKCLLYEIVAMDGNVGKIPGFLLVD